MQFGKNKLPADGGKSDLMYHLLSKDHFAAVGEQNEQTIDHSHQGVHISGTIQQIAEKPERHFIYAFT